MNKESILRKTRSIINISKKKDIGDDVDGIIIKFNSNGVNCEIYLWKFLFSRGVSIKDTDTDMYLGRCDVSKQELESLKKLVSKRLSDIKKMELENRIKLVFPEESRNTKLDNILGNG